MENLDTVKKRLLVYLKANRITQAEFGRIMGVSTAYVSTIRESISHDMQLKVKEAFPDLNMQWLLYGEGEMNIQGDGSNTQIGQNNYNSGGALEKAIDEIAEQRKLTAESQSQISRLLSIIETMQKGRI